MTSEAFFLGDTEAVCLRAASIFRGLAIKAVASEGRFSFAVSGGPTPLRLYEILGGTFEKDISLGPD